MKERDCLGEMSRISVRVIFLLMIFLSVINVCKAQEKISVQIKSFDSQLKPYRNIDLSIN
jgi:hypothetical protein